MRTHSWRLCWVCPDNATLLFAYVQLDTKSGTRIGERCLFVFANIGGCGSLVCKQPPYDADVGRRGVNLLFHNLGTFC